MAGAKGYERNTFKIEMAKQNAVRALTLAARDSRAGSEGATAEGASA